MNAYIVKDAPGHYLPSCAVVFAESEEEAADMLAAALRGQGVTTEYAAGGYSFKFVVVDPGEKRAHVLFNGDC